MSELRLTSVDTARHLWHPSAVDFLANVRVLQPQRLQVSMRKTRQSKVHACDTRAESLILYSISRLRLSYALKFDVT